MRHGRSWSAIAVVAFVLAHESTASAQVFGTFPWQMQPYCNVVTLTLTITPAGFTLDGVDDQCGATNKGSAVGVASFNAAGLVTLNFTVVTAPAGKPLHVSALVSPANGDGTWTDSVGNGGTFKFFGNTPGLPARPFPASGLAAASVTAVEIASAAIGAAEINTTQVQARVTGFCPAGQAVSAINANGTVVCVPALAQFRAVGHGTVPVPLSTLTTITGWSSSYNDGGGTFNSGTGVYVVPATGLYEISAVVRWQTFTAGGTGFAGLYVDVDGIFVETTTITPSTTNDFQLHQVMSTRKLAAGDPVRIRVYQTTGGAVTVGPGSNNQSSFTVTQLR